MPPTRKIHGLDGIPGLNGFEWFGVVLIAVESFLVVLVGLDGFVCFKRTVLRVPERSWAPQRMD